MLLLVTYRDGTKRLKRTYAMMDVVGGLSADWKAKVPQSQYLFMFLVASPLMYLPRESSGKVKSSSPSENA